MVQLVKDKFINCKMLAQNILDEVKGFQNKKSLVIITVGNNAASESYVKGKLKDCEYCGIKAEHLKFNDTDQEEVASAIHAANNNSNVGGIIVQLPLPDGWDEDYFTNLVAPEKDVDGFRPDSKFIPCTPKAIMHVLHSELGDLSGKIALVIGRGKLVGKPISQMLLDEDCMVTMVHSKIDKKNIDCFMGVSDIVIAATGKPHFFDENMCGHAVIIDCGVSKVGGHLMGDILPSDAPTSNRITSVPGGIGLLTRAMLMMNVAVASGYKERR